MPFVDAPISNASVRQRADELFHAARDANFRRTDRMFAVLMPIQWIAGIIAALAISPRTWRGTIDTPHIHVWAAVVLGGVITALPVTMALRRSGAALTRHTIAAGQILTSALLVHLTGGRIETHFHVFGSLAFLAFYRDWRVLLTATSVTALDHALRGLYFPQSVYGVLAADQWRWFEHLGWVLFEDVVLVLSCRRGTLGMIAIARQRARLEIQNQLIDRRVRERTEALAASESRSRTYAQTLELANLALTENQHELETRQQDLLHLNAALEQASDAARAASQSKSTFLANMSHEIRTPMTAILGFSELLRDPHTSDDERVDAVDTIRRNGHHLLSLINDILDISKIEAGRIAIERTYCNPVEIVNDVADLMRAQATARGIYLRVDQSGTLPRRVTTDPVRLKQIVFNLVSNAIKFTERGGVSVSLALDPTAERLTIHVRDTGIGISDDQLARIFEPFAQADASITRRFGGTGLGLAISKSLAALLGGELTATSHPGSGSDFVLQLSVGPLESVAAPAESSPGAATPATVRATTDQKPLLNRSILIVDDSIDNQRLLNTILTRAGATVSVVADGAQAVDAALRARDRGAPFDIILMDMQMPVMDGLTATRTLRAASYPGPIIALTASATTSDVAACRAAGCDQYLTKPIERRALVAVLAERLALAIS